MIKYILTVFTVWKTDRIKVNKFGNLSSLILTFVKKKLQSSMPIMAPIKPKISNRDSSAFKKPVKRPIL